MAIYDIATANDDWEFSSTVGRIDGATTLTSQWNNGVSPSVQVNALGDIDTSGMTDGVVPSSGIYYFYIDSYTATKGIAKTFNVQMLDKTDTTYTALTNGSGTFVAAGWYPITLTAAERAQIDDGTGADGKTRFRISVPDPASTNVRTMETRAREYATAGAWDMYLDLSFALIRQLASAGVGI